MQLHDVQRLIVAGLLLVALSVALQANAATPTAAAVEPPVALASVWH